MIYLFFIWIRFIINTYRVYGAAIYILMVNPVISDTLEEEETLQKIEYLFWMFTRHINCSIWKIKYQNKEGMLIAWHHVNSIFHFKFESTAVYSFINYRTFFKFIVNFEDFLQHFKIQYCWSMLQPLLSRRPLSNGLLL